MNPSLTTIVSYPTKQRPLMLDNVPASTDPEAGPFLITSSRALMWVERAFPSGFLRVAVRESGPHTLFSSMVEAIAEKGAEQGWGNVENPTHRGMEKAIAHLHYYGFKNLECLHGKGFKPTDVAEIPATLVEWLPPKWGVLVPVDRTYVGTVYDLGEGRVAGVIHNASRGVVVLR